MRLVALDGLRVRFTDASDPSGYLDVRGHQIRPGDVGRTPNGVTYVARVNPATQRLEFERQGVPPGGTVWWFFEELESPEIVGELPTTGR